MLPKGKGRINWSRFSPLSPSDEEERKEGRSKKSEVMKATTLIHQPHNHKHNHSSVRLGPMATQRFDYLTEEEESAEKGTQGEQQEWEERPTLAHLTVEGVPGEATRALKAGENTIGKSMQVR